MKWMLALLVVGLTGWGGRQEAPKPAAEKTNPVKATPESLAAGKKTYGFDCEMCHGKEGAGDGDLAESMKLKLKDYRDAGALKALTDGQIYDIILKGKGQMTGEEDRLKDAQIWNVVNYVRSLAVKNKA